MLRCRTRGRCESNCLGEKPTSSRAPPLRLIDARGHAVERRTRAASIGQLIACVQVAQKQEGPATVLQGDVGAARKERCLSFALWKIARQDNEIGELRLYQHPGARSCRPPTVRGERKRRSDETAVCGPAIRVAGTAHALCLGPSREVAARKVGAPFSQDNDRRIVVVEVLEQGFDPQAAAGADIQAKDEHGSGRLALER